MEAIEAVNGGHRGQCHHKQLRLLEVSKVENGGLMGLIDLKFEVKLEAVEAAYLIVFPVLLDPLPLGLGNDTLSPFFSSIHFC